MKDANLFTVSFHYLLYTKMTQVVNTSFTVQDMIQTLCISIICLIIASE